MGYRLLDLTGVVTREDFYNRIAEDLELSECGRNLDALHDVFSTSALTLVITGFEDMKKNLGAYADTFIMMMDDTADEHSGFTYILR